MNLKERKDYFIARAIAKHIDKYDYSESLYVRNNVKIKIKCNSCNKFFEQTPSNHLNHTVCCPHELHELKVKRNLKTNEQWINDFKDVHGNKYDYSLVDCKKWNDKIKIICPVHGEFSQEANSHMQGNGCFKCSIEKNTKSGLKRGKNLYRFYFVKFYNEDFSFLKIGVTSETVHKRCLRICRETGMSYELFKELLFYDYDKASEFESLIKQKLPNYDFDYKNYGLSKFKGHMECRLPINFNAINEIINSTIKDIG